MSIAGLIKESEAPAIPIVLATAERLADVVAGLTERHRRWLSAVDFTAMAGSFVLLPAPDGGLEAVIAGVSDPPALADLGDLAVRLPPGTYRLADDAPCAGRLALGWALGAYSFTRYRRREREPARLLLPGGTDGAAALRAAEATTLARDLINTPAEDMGPDALAEAAGTLAARHGAACSVIVGDALLEAGHRAIHTVGRAAARAPRLVDLTWGDPAAPRVTLIGKGVCFDTGGLDLKPAGGMELMKKDMGGAANVLGLAHMVMDAALPVRLRVLVPAVENAVSGNAFRPLDVIRLADGSTVEVGNTDAEGRLVLADAIAVAVGDKPALMVDFATLTGAARVALGTDLPALFANDDSLAEAILEGGCRAQDPLWRMPLWAGYRELLDSAVADVSSTGKDRFAGAITAALFLERGVAGIPWAHIDLMAYNLATRPARPRGGEAMGMRAVYTALETRFGGTGA